MLSRKARRARKEGAKWCVKIEEQMRVPFP